MRMKKVYRALYAFEYQHENDDLVDVLKYEFTSKDAKPASVENWATSRKGIYLVFYDNQVIKRFHGDCWSVRTKTGWLQPTRSGKGYLHGRGDEVWVKGKPHLLIIKRRYLSDAVITLCKKYGVRYLVS